MTPILMTSSEVCPRAAALVRTAIASAKCLISFIPSLPHCSRSQTVCCGARTSLRSGASRLCCRRHRNIQQAPCQEQNAIVNHYSTLLVCVGPADGGARDARDGAQIQLGTNEFGGGRSPLAAAAG